MCGWSCSTATAHPPNGGRPARHSTRSQWGPIRCAFVLSHVSPYVFLDERRGAITRHYAPLISHTASYFRICQKAVCGTFGDGSKRTKLGQNRSTHSRHAAAICRGNCLAGAQTAPFRFHPHRRSIVVAAAGSPRYADGSLSQLPQNCTLGLSASHPPACCRHTLWRSPRNVSGRWWRGALRQISETNLRYSVLSSKELW